MRHLIIQVPEGDGQIVTDKVQKHQGTNIVQLSGTYAGHGYDIILVDISNNQVEDILNELQDLSDLHITFDPRGVVALKPPPEKAPDQVTDIEPKSPFEIYLAGLQSIGSWKGFLGYAIAAGVVVWIGLYTNTIFLLVAAMLIAPFAGPAMNTAIATSRGDWPLLRQSLLRYFAALGITIIVAGLVSLVVGQRMESTLMVDVSQLSSYSILLPLVAGAAGALQQVQSERSSLVSGAAVGVLVAASLAPPAGIIGMAASIGKWEMVKNSLFLLLLQLAGINLSGYVVFSLYGLTTGGPRFNRGNRRVKIISLSATFLILIALLIWQQISVPEFERSSISQQAVADINDVLKNNSQVFLIRADVNFTRSNISGQNTLLCILYTQRTPGTTVSSPDIAKTVTRQVQEYLLARHKNITPLVNVTVLDLPKNAPTP